jgi:hypothetical protein
VLALAMQEGALEISTLDPDAFYRDLAPLLVEHELPVTRVTSPDDRLEAVYDYLVGRP